MFNVYILKNIFNAFFINSIILILFILIGGILPLYERKILSLMQRRVGPRYVGYKGRLQFLADAVKVLIKESIYLFGVNKIFFFLLPISFLNLNCLLVLNIIWANNTSYYSIEYNILFFIIIEIMSHIIIMITGIILKNKYTLIASSRSLNITFIAELFTTTLLSIVFIVFNTFSINFLLVTLNNYYKTILLLPMIPLFVFLFLVSNGKVPFDLIEAETEIIMGYHVEYSGFLSAIYILVEYIHVLFFLYFLFIIFI